MYQTISHTQREQKRKTVTCFGLAEAMAHNLKKGEFEQDTTEAEGKTIPVYRLKDASIPLEQGGRAKVNAALPILLHGLADNMDNRRAKNDVIGSRAENGAAHLWIQAFDRKEVDFPSVAATLRELKNLCNEVKHDPVAPYHDFARRAEGSYWMGPFNNSTAAMAEMVVTSLAGFHAMHVPVRVANMYDNTFYFDCERKPMLQLLQKEGMIGKGKI